MTYDELAQAYFALQGLSTFTAGLLIVVGVLLAAMPIGTCDKCAHCRQQRTKSSGRGPVTYCRQHNKSRSECEDEHRP